MRISNIFLAALLLGATQAAAQEARQVNERFAAPAAGSLRVENLAGRVEIRGWDRNEIEVTGRLGPMVERLEIERGANSVIRVVTPRNVRGDASARLQIRVPAGQRVEVRVVSSSVEISELRGVVSVNAVSGRVQLEGAPREAELRSVSGGVQVSTSGSERVSVSTASGRVRLEGVIRGRAEVETISGGISIEGTSGDVRARTASGGITVRGVTGSVDLSTVSGGANVEAGTLSRLSFRSVSGGLRFAGGLSPGSIASLETHSGTIELRLPARVSADFEVSTFSGRIENAFGPAAQRVSQYGPGSELRFTAGQGGASVAIRTFSGGVRLQRQ